MSTVGIILLCAACLGFGMLLGAGDDDFGLIGFIIVAVVVIVALTRFFVLL